MEPLKHYEKLLQTIPEIERKGKAMPYTSKNGNMFSFLDKEGNMGLRLSKEDREEFINEYQSELMVQHGRIMKEYVKVSAELLQNTALFTKSLKKSYDYVSSLKPKPTKKAKKQ